MDCPGSRGLAGAASLGINSSSGYESRHQSPVRRSNQAIARLLLLLLSVNLAMSLYQLPLNRVIERRLCNDHYYREGPGDASLARPDRGDISEELCKIDEVQQDLARIQQIMEIVWILGDIVMTIPLGFLAEKYGRQAILLLNLCPRIAMLAWAVTVNYFDDWLPARAIVAAPFLSFLGGDCVLNSIMYALAAGLKDDNVDRAKYFGYMASVTYVVNLAGPTLASLTMGIRLWLPFIIGIMLLGHAVRFIKLLPQEPRLRHMAAADDEVAQLLGPHSSNVAATTATGNQKPPADAATVIRGALVAVKRRFQVLYAVLSSRPRNLWLLLFSMFLTSFASADTKLLVQYISKRYHKTFASAGYILSCKAVVNFVLLGLAIPALLEARRRRERHRPERGRSISRDGSPSRQTSQSGRNRIDALVCLGVSVAGALAVGLAGSIYLLIPSLLLYAMGSALPIFTLSLLKSPQVWPSTSSTPIPQPYSPSSQYRDVEGGYGASGAPSGSDRTDIHGEAEDHDTTVFSIVMLVKTVGSLVGVPVVTSVWIRGIGLGGNSLGLPYIVSAGVYALATCAIAAIKPSD